MLRNVPVSVRDVGVEAMVGRTWLDPIGGFGDVLMLSGVLAQIHEQDPSRKFHLVTRTRFTPLLKDHPALEMIGHPPPGARLQSTAYWQDPGFEAPGARAYQVLARMLGLPTPCEEKLWTPQRAPLDPVLSGLLPPRPRVLVSAATESPRKAWPLERWRTLVARLVASGISVVQAGLYGEEHLEGARDFRGMTRVTEVPALIAAMDAVVTADNFVMHAAAMEKIPGVVLWGPTRPEVYGYPVHRHLHAEPECDEAPTCISAKNPRIYPTPCPEGERHCVATLGVEAVLGELAGILGRTV